MYYKPQFPEWLALASRDGRGGAAAEPPTIVRGKTRSFVLNLSTHPTYGNWTAGSFSSVLRASPDASGAALATWAVSVGTPSGGVTPVTFTLEGSAQGSIPVDSDSDGLTELVMQVDYTPPAGTPDPIIQTNVFIVGSV